MENPLSRIYERMDNGLVNLGDIAAYNWNRITADTKAELSNKLLTASTILSTAALASVSPIAGLATFIMFHTLNRDRKRRNLDYECIQTKLADGEEIDQNSRDFLREKEIGYKTFALPFMAVACAATMYSSIKSIQDPRELALAVLFFGAEIETFSRYTMRSKYLPAKAVPEIKGAKS